MRFSRCAAIADRRVMRAPSTESSLRVRACGSVRRPPLEYAHARWRPRSCTLVVGATTDGEGGMGEGARRLRRSVHEGSPRSVGAALSRRMDSARRCGGSAPTNRRGMRAGERLGAAVRKGGTNGGRVAPCDRRASRAGAIGVVSMTPMAPRQGHGFRRSTRTPGASLVGAARRSECGTWRRMTRSGRGAQDRRRMDTAIVSAMRLPCEADRAMAARSAESARSCV